MSLKQSGIAVHNKIGNWLREKRLEKGITQKALAEILGRSVSFVGKYESGRRLEIVTALAICLSLGADPHELVKMVENFRANGSQSIKSR